MSDFTNKKYALSETRIIVQGRWKLFRSVRKDGEDVLHIAKQLEQYLSGRPDAKIVSIVDKK